MSSELSSKTVADLKLLLKENGLSTDGKKAELIQRLEEHQQQQQQTGEHEQPAQEEQQQQGEQEEQQQSEEIQDKEQEENTKVEGEGDAEGESTLTVIQPKESPKQLTAEERKQLAISLLEKKIKRAEKFGDEKSANDAKKDLKRVEKFGVELGTSLAKEIGLVDNSLSNNNSKNNRRFNRGFKKFHNKKKKSN